MILYYLIPKEAHYKDNTEICGIGIHYEPTGAELVMSKMEVTRLKREWIAKQLNLNPIFVIPCTFEKYCEIAKEDKNV